MRKDTEEEKNIEKRRQDRQADTLEVEDKENMSCKEDIWVMVGQEM